ncbi:hypothetical protein CK203_067879 [Vitis vinifera]|uniref:DUF4283 domain-containing protein n=1 Tax=Vitis vinifera TaxID=29760 RepID=A0A438BZB7_VITVI|nr:hypothetical protein CK203_067879 [Vitis vinifera]
MSERARERVSVREGESDGRERGERRAPEGLEGETRLDAEGDGFVGVRSRAKKGSFGVESKWFDVKVREQKGKVQASIIERKGGVSSWIRLGPNSIGCFIDGLESCIENADLEPGKGSGRTVGGPILCGDKSGWVLMAEILRRLGCYVREESLQKKGAMLLRPAMGKTYAEVAMQSKGRETTVVRVELCKRELSRNMERLVHCLVGSWNPSSGKGDDLRGWGTNLAKFWSLKGNLGIAKLERGKVLLEFEVLAEAEKALKIGGFSCAGSPLSLEKWRPERRCLLEGKRGVRLGPAVRMARERKGKNKLVSEDEVGGEVTARAGGRVRGLVGGPSLEVRLQSDDGTWGQSSGSGPAADPDSGLVLDGPHESCGLTSQWALGPSEASGPFPPTASPREAGPSHLGLTLDYGRASKKLIGGAGLGGRGPNSSLDFNMDDTHLRGARSLNGLGPSSVGDLDQSRSSLLVMDGLWRPLAEKQSLEENSKTDDALMEEP